MDESDFIGCCPTSAERPKMNDRSLLLPLNKITHYFTLKNGRLQVVFFKYIYCLYENLMLQIDHFNSSPYQKLQYLDRTLRL